MESNKDDSVKCIRISNNYLTKGDFERALKFAYKSQKLYPSKHANDLIELIQKAKDLPQSSESAECNANGDGVRHRRKSHSSTNGSATTNTKEEAVVAEPEYTAEQLEAVRKIKHCKNYYEILGVAEDAAENDFKKSYRKLALQFHPDKNKAPGATEAFKAIGNAYSTLSDPRKRRDYDLYGADEQKQASSRRNGHSQGYSHRFESEVSPEELFNMFFGGSAFTYTTRQNRPRNFQTESHHHRHRRDRTEDNAFTLFYQLAPILMMVLLSVLSLALQGEEPYQFNRSQNYPHPRTTHNYKVNYYVKDGFSKVYTARSLNKLEREIEQVYIANLRNECYKEQMQREQLRWKAKYRNDGKAYEQASKMEMRSCDRLQAIYGGS